MRAPSVSHALCLALAAAALLGMPRMAAAEAETPTPGATQSAPAAGTSATTASAATTAVDAAPTEVPAVETPRASGIESDPTSLSAKAVAGIPLDDGGEVVLGPEEKVTSEDRKAVAARFKHLNTDAKLAASSDLDREVPRILRREQGGDAVGALRAARAALGEMPHHRNLRQITARLQIATNDFPGALLTLAPLLEIDEDQWLPFYWAGVAELMQQHLDNARRYLTRASQLDADHAETWIARAVVEQEAGNFAGALQLFAVARQRSPASPEIETGIAYSEAMLRPAPAVLEAPRGATAPEAIASQTVEPVVAPVKPSPFVTRRPHARSGGGAATFAFGAVLAP